MQLTFQKARDTLHHTTETTLQLFKKGKPKTHQEHTVSALKMETVCSYKTLVSVGSMFPKHWYLEAVRSSEMLVSRGSMFLRNVGIYLQVHTALVSRRPTQTSPPP
jgi:hypothetical protein